MLERLRRLHPFKTPDAQRLALLFGTVYFAQGMWYLPNQTITIVLKERGLSAGQVADFFLVATVPWLIKPVYGLISDFVPLWGRRRKSYYLLTTSLAIAAGTALASWAGHPYRAMMVMFTIMGLGLAFTDVLTDALMVENGRPRGLTGAFQSVQWAAITAASVAVGLLGGQLAGARNLALAFALAACLPVVSLVMGLRFIDERPGVVDREAVRETWRAIRTAMTDRSVWVVAGFIFFYTFSPSFGPAFLYYQTDVLKFSQEFIGALDSMYYGAAMAGAIVYAPLSRRMPLKRLIVAAIGAALVSTLAYLFYRDRISAIGIQVLFGVVAMITQLAFLDLAAKACPRRVEATFFALLMSVYNAGVQLSQNVGARLYDGFGYTPLVLISAALTVLAWPLVPLVRIDRIEAKAWAERESEAPTARG
ncbi:MAG TPA: MFS transporter [Methylomirabilota bacterium]|nr:MFS transporter [Methylomirabilota bacterium]